MLKLGKSNTLDTYSSVHGVLWPLQNFTLDKNFNILISFEVNRLLI